MEFHMILTHIKEELGQWVLDNAIYNLICHVHILIYNTQRQLIITQWPDKGPAKMLLQG